MRLNVHENSTPVGMALFWTPREAEKQSIVYKFYDVPACANAS